MVLVRRDAAFLDGIVNLPSGYAPQSYIRMPLLSSIGTKICQASEMLELVVLVGLREVRLVKML